MAYTPGDKIFAKVKGHPHWPCRINLLPPDVHIPKGKFPIFFYGTHEVYFLGPKDIFPYEKYKAKYAVSRNKPLFQAGLREIEENPDVLLYGKDPDAEAFLARFYKFDFTGIQAPPQVSTGKRSGSTPVADKEYEKPAKRPHVETPIQPAPPSKKQTTSSDVPKVAKPRRVQNKTHPTTKPASNKSTSQRRASRPQLPSAPLAGSATTENHSATPLRPQRVSSLRLRIRKGADGLQFSPAHNPSLSSLSPPTSTSTASTAGAEQVIDESSKLTQEPLRITIKTMPATSTTDDKTEPSTPVGTVFSISNSPLATTADGGTPTPSGTTSSSVSTAASTALTTTTLTTTASTLMGVGNNSAIMARKKSTAVVTPLRRDKVLPQLSDESADLSSLSEDEVAGGRNDRKRISARNVPTRRDKHRAVDVDRSPLRFLHTDTGVSHSRLKRRKKKENSLTKDAANTNISSFGGSGSETGSCSATTSPWASNDWSKSGSSQTGPEQQSPRDAQKKRTSVPSSSPPSVTSPPPSRSAMGAPSPLPPRKQQEQQLKDLDTEARLLLIDRSIKSSLVRDHEDISTCVDRLEMLDRIQISLPVLAKCWIVVETIRKCRRYKRSMEVKIAAQKVFNKFLQLYATADKCELDLANAELAKHQQRHIKQHLAAKGDLSTSGSLENSVVPPYMGPKTMSELFQLSAAALAERRRINQLAENASTHGVISPATSSIDSSDIASTLTSSEAMKRLNLHVDLDSAGGTSRANKFSLRDIPLPSETNSALPKPTSVSNEVRPSAPATVGSVNPEEEYEVLDEYEAASDLKFGITANRHSEPAHPISAPAASSSIEYIPTTMVETQIIPYHLVPPHMLPGPNGSLPPAYCPENYACPASVAPYSVAYSPMSGAVPYSFTCLPSVPYPQVLHPSQLGPPYNPAISAAVHPVGIEVTPPQIAARAYVPHSLQPCADPPPYRPYLPEPEVERPADSPKRPEYHPSHGRHQESDKRSGSFVRPNFKVKSRSPPRPLSSSSSSHGRRESSDRHSRHHRSLRTPPRRARSPHELPHPLEHYQRYLKSALTSDEDTDERAPTSHRHQKTSEDRYSTSITSRLFEDGRLIRSRTDSDIGGKTQSSKNITEDLDTRIARIIGTATTTNKTQAHSDVKDMTKTSDIQKPLLVSPPPPPPPPTASQRVLFTHRPHQGVSSEARSIVKHVPCPPVLHSRGPASVSKQHPPPTPDSPPPPPRRCLPSAQPPSDAVNLVESRLSSKVVTPSTTSSMQPTVSSNPPTSTTPTSRPPSVVVIPSEDEHSGAPRTREDDRDLYTLLGV
ncbi:hypothetical protein CSKR_113102 [Clonorchis sinensis]|uniref:PWWP domain-containing protein n=1 Tax=Clonorchis sinensis TaxID=79923 RepID=A0A8T1MZX5_CLOSI|nr:hypothetical protein CSKR_113102 [Clonorchis sinensis]